MSITLTNINKSFGTPPNQVLFDITLDIQEGDFVSLTGRSGSGKSTLLYIISTLDTPTSGNIQISGIDITALSSQEIHRFRNEEMGFVFQFHYLLPEITALENVLMPARKTGKHKQIQGYATELLNEFGLGDKLNRLPRELSGGEQQRVAIARALALKPKYLFADEPTGNLDSMNGETVMSIFKKVNTLHKTTIIMVTHELDFANMATRKIQLADGRVVLDAKNAEHKVQI